MPTPNASTPQTSLPGPADTDPLSGGAFGMLQQALPTVIPAAPPANPVQTVLTSQVRSDACKPREDREKGTFLRSRTRFWKRKEQDRQGPLEIEGWHSGATAYWSICGEKVSRNAKQFTYRCTITNADTLAGFAAKYWEHLPCPSAFIRSHPSISLPQLDWGLVRMSARQGRKNRDYQHSGVVFMWHVHPFLAPRGYLLSSHRIGRFSWSHHPAPCFQRFWFWFDIERGFRYRNFCV